MGLGILGDEWGVLAFLEQLQGPDGLPAKSVIVSDHSIRISRWEALGMRLIAESPSVETLLTDQGVRQVTSMMESLTSEQIMEAFIPLHGRPSFGRFWTLPRQRRLLVGLSPIHGMTYTCVQGMAIRMLIPPEMNDDLNPFEPLFQLFGREVSVDWDRWRFTNMRHEDLGAQPDPIL